MDIFNAAKSGKWAEVLKHIGEIEKLDEDGNTLLMVVAMNGNIQMMKALVGSGANLNTLGKGHNSALSFACKAGHVRAVRELLDSGASPSSTNEDEETPLHLAVKGGHDLIVSLLLDHGADMDAVNKAINTSRTAYSSKEDHSPLYLAVLNNAHPIISTLLKRGANPNYSNIVGNAPLIVAAYRGKHQTVVVLLQHGADPNYITSEGGCSALYWSSKNGAYATAKALLDAGANPCHVTKNGSTPLNSTADELMKRMIRIYLSGSPSWLAEQLCARGLEWPVVCDIEDKLLKEGFVSKDIFLAAPMSLFTHEYLRSLGITHFGTRLVVITVRLEGTWLGARLAGLGVSPFWIRSCETCVFEALGCGTEKAFVSLPAAALSAEALKEVGVPVQYHLVLRALQEQLGKAREEKEERKDKEKNDSSVAAVTSGATNSAVAITGHVEHTEEEAV